MAINNSYDSKINKLYDISKIRLELRKAKLNGTLIEAEPHVFLVNESCTDVPPFIHPILDDDKKSIYVDARGYISTNRDGETFKIRNEADYDLNVLRARLELVWGANTDHDDEYNALNYSQEIFTRWLSELIVYRYGLNQLQKVKMVALTAMYTIGLYYNGVTDPILVGRYNAMIAQKFYLDIGTVQMVAESIGGGYPRDIDEYVKAIHDLDLSPRLRDLSTVSIYNDLGGSWFITANSTEITALAIEFPPCFTALIAMAIKYNMFKRTSIGQTVHNFNRQNAHKVFVSAVDNLLHRYRV